MFEFFINNIDRYYDDLVIIQFGLLVIICTLFLWVWYFNRRKYHNLKHVIPAKIVKNYLDSIIQNSEALKSSLFRGGGVGVEGVPSVLPLGSLSGGESIGLSGAPSTALMEELNQKKAHIATLESQLASYLSAQRELEGKSQVSQHQLSTAELKIRELEALLARARESGGGDEALKQELIMTTKERDEIRERLREFEIISDDLANLKRLQQENEQLKRSLAAVKGGSPNIVPVSTEPDISSLDVASNILNEIESLNSSSANTENSSANNADSLDLQDIMKPSEESSPLDTDNVANIDLPQVSPENRNENQKNEKTPEDLLSEFEKMLG